MVAELCNHVSTLYRSLGKSCVRESHHAKKHRYVASDARAPDYSSCLKADFIGAKVDFPSCSIDEVAWARVFTEKPDVMYNLLAAIFTAGKAEQERMAGVGRRGRRAQRVPHDTAEFMTVVFGSP